MSAPARDPIALMVVGGFLGAGKTTLLHGLLRDASVDPAAPTSAIVGLADEPGT